MAMTDAERERYLRDLDDSDYEVSDWEASFVSSCIGREYFTPKQRQVIESLMEKYPEV